MWGSLLPLIVGSALVPIQLVVTTLLLRSGAGRMTAVAWVAGMTTVRLVQGLIFGLILGSAVGEETADEQGAIASVLLLVVAILFYATALKQLLGQPDEDAPSPRWMAKIEGVTPGRAYLLGLAVITISAKVWVFTLGAIAVIGEADLGQTASVLTFVAFVVLAESTHLILLGMAYVAPARAGTTLDRIAGFLESNNRLIVIALGAIFGTWFLIKALVGLGIL